MSPYPGACVVFAKEGKVNRRNGKRKLPFDGSDHSLQLTRLEPSPLPEIGLPDDVQLADHRHALDDAGLLRVLRLRLQAVQILPSVHGLQVGHLAEGALPGRRRKEDEESSPLGGTTGTLALLLLCVSGHDRVELCDVVHHGWLQRDLLHEHGGGGDVLDLSLQEHFICLERRGAKSIRAPAWRTGASEAD